MFAAFLSELCEFNTSPGRPDILEELRSTCGQFKADAILFTTGDKPTFILPKVSGWNSEAVELIGTQIIEQQIDFLDTADEQFGTRYVNPPNVFGLVDVREAGSIFFQLPATTTSVDSLNRVVPIHMWTNLSFLA